MSDIALFCWEGMAGGTSECGISSVNSTGATGASPSVGMGGMTDSVFQSQRAMFLHHQVCVVFYHASKPLILCYPFLFGK